MPQIRPLHDLVLASRVSDAPRPSGIVVPEGMDRGPVWRMKAIAVGPGTTDDRGRFVPTTIRPGDEFLAPPFSDFEHRIDGQTYWIVPERRALAVYPWEPEAHHPERSMCAACASPTYAQPTTEA